MKNPHTVILHPHITEKSVALSYGDPRVKDDKWIQRQYTFIVAPDANKIEIKQAFEEIYNAGKRAKDERIAVANVRTISVRGKTRRVGFKNKGKKSDFKKAVITLGRGQVLEDYGV